jgi:predicted TIM-barrel fold metal-dependent hydrolase
MNFEPVAMTALREVPADTWRPPAGVRVISADDHNMEAQHLWEERLPAKWKDKAPKFWIDQDGAHLEAEGRALIVPGLPAESERCAGFSDPVAKLRDMDAEGVEASLLYTGRAGALFGLADTDLFWACMDVYNEWLAEHTRPYARRLIGVPVLPTYLQPEATADYLVKLKEWGCKAVQLPCAPRGVRYNSRAYDPMWKAIAESGLPLSFHIALQLPFSGYGSMGANLATILCPYRPLLAQLMFAGIFERFPTLKVVFTEGGASWAANALTDMDYMCKVYHARLNPKLGQLPSFYWHRQCYTTFMYDPVAIELVHRIGAGNILWSTDYPHAESTFGFSGEIMREIWDKAGPKDATKILGGNAAGLWGI